ncbi:MAG TPA: transcription elongation factor GreA [Candidatus Paceibacterota bacterium]|jgi:transcription elongation factor GreA|nr:transcription elongation factor GreA [Candidatus Paceibacterota bacterium]
MPDNQKEYLTQEKFNELEKELEQLKTVRRKEVAEELEYAKGLGDLSENAEYHEARDRQATVEDRIAKLEDILKRAVIVSEKDHSSDIVNIGSTVTVKKDGAGSGLTYKIVGSEESDMSQGHISIRSPFGESILGKKKGDEFSFKAPSGMLTYKVVEIK